MKKDRIRFEAIEMTEHVLDTKGLHCPLPVLKTRKALKVMSPGEVLTVYATDPASSIDFRHFCDTSGNELLDYGEADGVFTYRIRRCA